MRHRPNPLPTDDTTPDMRPGRCTRVARRLPLAALSLLGVGVVVLGGASTAGAGVAASGPARSLVAGLAAQRPLPVPPPTPPKALVSHDAVASPASAEYALQLTGISGTYLISSKHGHHRH
jgi:hypothetical protein